MDRPAYDPTIVAALGDPGWLARAAAQDGGMLADAAAIYLGFDSAIRTLRDEIASLKNAGRLTPAGLADEAASRGRAAAADLRAIAERIGPLKAQADQLAAPEDTGGIGNDAPLVARIWDWLPGDNPALFAAYLDAIEAGDALTVTSIETLPRFLPQALTQAQRAEGARLRLARTDPERARALELLTTVIADLEAARDGALREVARLAGLTVSDLAEAA